MYKTPQNGTTCTIKGNNGEELLSGNNHTVIKIFVQNSYEEFFFSQFSLEYRGITLTFV